MPRSFSRRPSRHRSGGAPSRTPRPSGQRRPRGRGAKRPVDPSRFINTAIAPAEVAPYTPTHRFVDFPFDERLKAAIVAKGYDQPTAIQDQAIPHVLAGKDLVGLANTGTGKTASFVLPIIHRLITQQSKMALILAPTRELAQQIDDEFRSFANTLGVRSAVCVGGVRENPQIAALRRKPAVVIGTPGRLKDFVQQGHLKLQNCDTFVLDEADRMLDMGFLHDMKFLMGRLPTDRQSLCLSATITGDIQKIIDKLLRDPVTVSVRTPVTSEHIEQRIIQSPPAKDDKFEILVRLLQHEDFQRVLIFGETKYGVQRLAEKLAKRDVTATAIHGNKNQNQRQKALDAFKAGSFRVLVATDVAARGIDVDDVSHVINYDPPRSYEDYVHRIGRTGRAGKGGNAITFV